MVDWADRGEDWSVVEPVDRLDGRISRGSAGRPRYEGRSLSGSAACGSSNARPGADVRFDYAVDPSGQADAGLAGARWSTGTRTASTERRPSTSPSRLPWNRVPRSATIEPAWAARTVHARDARRSDRSHADEPRVPPIDAASRTSRSMKAWAEAVSERARASGLGVGEHGRVLPAARLVELDRRRRAARTACRRRPCRRRRRGGSWSRAGAR